MYLHHTIGRYVSSSGTENRFTLMQFLEDIIMTYCFVKSTVSKRITYPGTHSLLGLVCCFIMMLGVLLAPRNSHAIERAEKKAAIVSQLFKLDSSETYHDYNNYGDNPNWANIVGGYIGGHSGWDVQTVSVAREASADESFYSLTDGVVIRAGTSDSEPDSFNTIAVYNNGITTLYLHARNTFVYFGQKVRVGSCLGIQGNAGLWPPKDPADRIKYENNPDSYREHVHIEVIERYTTEPTSGAVNSIDPIDYLYSQVIAATPMSITKADVNQDGKVNATDAVLIIKHLRENPQQFDSQLDVNGDGVVDIPDVLAIIDILYGYACELVRNAAPVNPSLQSN